MPGRRTLSPDVAAEIVRATQDGDRTLDRIRALGLRVVTVEDPAYPSRLAAIDLPPHLLFVDGDPAALDAEHAIAVVGTRRASNAGRALASRVAGALTAAGASVVSGLAIGIDGAAHAATLDAGGRTVAVIGGGHGHLYPRAHARLAEAITAGGGAVVSELAPDLAPTAGTFPRRNRIVSGLADATVVIEAPARSGALITASWALEQGRDCFLAPGAIDDPGTPAASRSCASSRASARIVAGVPQLIEDLGLATRPSAAGATPLAGATLLELGDAAGPDRRGAAGRAGDRRRAGGGHGLAGRDRPGDPHGARAQRPRGRRRGPVPTRRHARGGLAAAPPARLTHGSMLAGPGRPVLRSPRS